MSAGGGLGAEADFPRDDKLNGHGQFVVGGIAVDDEPAREAFFAEHVVSDLCGPRLSEPEEAQAFGAEEPGIAILSVGAPARFVGVFDRVAAVFFERGSCKTPVSARKQGSKFKAQKQQPAYYQ